MVLASRAALRSGAPSALLGLLVVLHHLLVGCTPPRLHVLLLPAGVGPQVHAAGHGAVVHAAVLRVDLQQRPHPAAHLAAALVLHLALEAVLEEHAHALAVLRRALGVLAHRGVHEELHRALQLLLALPRCVAQIPGAGVAPDPLLFELVRVREVGRADAVVAHVVVTAHAAPVAGARLDFARADVARAHKGGFVGVVQVVQHHHGAVLRAPQGVELVVVPLAQREELLACFEDLALHVGVLVRHKGHRLDLLFLELVDHHGARGVPPLLVEPGVVAMALLAQREIPAAHAGVLGGAIDDVLAAVRAHRLEVHHDEVFFHGLDLLAQPRHHLGVPGLHLGSLLAFGAGRAPLGRLLALALLALAFLRRGLLLAQHVEEFLHGAGQVVAIEVGEVGEAAGVNAVLPPALEEQIQQVGVLVHDAPRLGVLQHAQVPRAQTVVLRGLLPGGVAVEDVVVPGKGRAHPDVHRREPSLFEVVEVGNENLLIDGSAQALALAVLVSAVGHDALRPEVLDRVQVTQVAFLGVGFRALLVVLLHVHAEEGQVHALALLEQEDDLGLIGELLRHVRELLPEFGHQLRVLPHAAHHADVCVGHRGDFVKQLPQRLGPILPFLLQEARQRAL
mmetsp:Transcript_6309/g.17839  ORF Transcript_6309/g.17839 Transcript_6309/m.17839 type:complete len:621 (-) Transcript_6309:1810-3672(-)